ncbi:hypothetical protein ACFZDK_50990 [Streptomyces sp. NPDC007901]|uniref:hypothetical protein n=1 Tax=Streptomyces sp. NPDC007901 TaxID=3364785 RepID=UPI0036E4FD90
MPVLDGGPYVNGADEATRFQLEQRASLLMENLPGFAKRLQAVAAVHAVRVD